MSPSSAQVPTHALQPAHTQPRTISLALHTQWVAATHTHAHTHVHSKLRVRVHTLTDGYIRTHSYTPKCHVYAGAHINMYIHGQTSRYAYTRATVAPVRTYTPAQERQGESVSGGYAHTGIPNITRRRPLCSGNASGASVRYARYTPRYSAPDTRLVGCLLCASVPSIIYIHPGDSEFPKIRHVSIASGLALRPVSPPPGLCLSLRAAAASSALSLPARHQPERAIYSSGHWPPTIAPARTMRPRAPVRRRGEKVVGAPAARPRAPGREDRRCCRAIFIKYSERERESGR